MTAKHTPGPWGKIGVPYAEYWIVPQEDADAPAPKTVRRIANIEGPRPIYRPSYPIDVAEANACLITAAPDMLEALKNIENDGNQVPPHAWALIQAAIAKAEGGKP